MKKVKVLIIDDSALTRDILSRGLGSDPEIEVLGAAPDVYVARDRIVQDKPDVLTLDVEMPRMDGVEFLRRLMPQYPLPVIMVSAMTAPNAKITLEALELGAVDFVLKPSSSFGNTLWEMMEDLREKVKAAARVDVSRFKGTPLTIKNVPAKSRKVKVLEGTTDKVLALGASTGGTVALRELISGFPSDLPGTVIVQHMPPNFTRMFAEKLNEISRVEVKEAESGDRIITGRVLIAPGGYHMEVIRSGGYYHVRVTEGEKVFGHCPSVEVLFNSVAAQVGSNAVGVILTGMGRDGATGMLALRNAGGRTLAQDEASSVVFGMPKEAYLCGGAEELVPLSRMSEKILHLLKGKR